MKDENNLQDVGVRNQARPPSLLEKGWLHLEADTFPFHGSYMIGLLSKNGRNQGLAVTQHHSLLLISDAPTVSIFQDRFYLGRGVVPVPVPGILVSLSMFCSFLGLGVGGKCLFKMLA